MKILVMSCDKNIDIFYIFHYCMEKYWSDHPEIIYCTETVINPYYKTICKNYNLNKWTARVRESIAEIDDNYIILMVDDIFIKEKVNNKLVLELIKQFDNKIAAINFEKSFSKDDFTLNNMLMKRNSKGRVKISLMCQLWNKQKMLDIFNIDTNPWEFEKLNNGKAYDFLIFKDYPAFNWGHFKEGDKWGLVGGKWTPNAINIAIKENINIYNSLYTRGVIDE